MTAGLLSFLIVSALTAPAPVTSPQEGAAGAGRASAADMNVPRIVGETEVPEHRLVKLSAEGVNPKAGQMFRVTPAEGVDKADVSKGKLQFTAPPGAYTVTLLVVSLTKDGEVDLKEASVLVTIGGKGPRPPPKDPPPKDPPVTPPIAAKLYFLIVRPDGPASPEFTKVMSDPAWATLQGKGHQVKDRTVTDANRIVGLVLPPGTVLPTVVTLDVSAGTESRVVAGPVPLPTTSAEILKLPEGVR